MLGAPVTGSADEWQHLDRVVSGRIVNGYSRYLSIYWHCRFQYIRAFSLILLVFINHEF